MKTFYIASAGVPEQRSRVKILAEMLKKQFGWTWHGGWDWTDNYDPNELKSHRAYNDLVGARDCDVFIFWQTEVNSLGANREYGVRWGIYKKIYHLCETNVHLFDTVDHVETVHSLDALMTLLKVDKV